MIRLSLSLFSFLILGLNYSNAEVLCSDNHGSDQYKEGELLNAFAGSNRIVNVNVMSRYSLKTGYFQYCLVEAGLVGQDTTGPLAGFNHEPVVCLGQCYNFENTSTGAVSYYWTFNGAIPASSKEENPTGICYINQTGTYNVTLTATDISGSSSSITQQITVVNPPNLNAGPDQYISGGASTTLSATGGNGSGNFMWQPAELVSCSDCPSTATVSLFETTTFTVGYIQAGGCLAFDEMTVFVDSVSSVDDSAEDFELSVYPNPGTGEFTLVLPRVKNSVKLEIFDLHGKCMHSRKYSQGTIPVDLTDVPAGIYILKVTTEDRSSIAKIVKQ